MNSVIICAVVNVFKKTYNVFAVSYENSLFKKCFDFIKNLIKKSAEKSSFIKYFTTNQNYENNENNSVIFKSYSRFYNYIKTLTLKFNSLLNKSVIISWYKFFFDNVLDISISIYGIMIMSACIGNIIFSHILKSFNFVSVIFFLVGLVISLIKISIRNIISGSFILKKVFSYFGINFVETDSIVVLNYNLSIIFSIVGLILGLIWTVYSPITSILLLCCLVGLPLVLYNFKVTVYLIPIMLPFLPTMALVGLVLISFMSMIIKMLTDEKFTFKRTPIDLFLVTFAFVLTISAFTSVTPVKSIQILLVYIAFILSFFLITNSVTTKNQLYTLMSIVMMSALFVALYGIYQFIFGFDEGKVWIDSEMFSEIETRVVSTFENPNVLGEYLLLMIPITFSFIWNAPKNFSKFSHLIIAGILALCMIFTYSRGNWIGLAVACILFFTFYDRKFIWLAVIALLLSPTFLPQNVIDRFLSIGNTKDTSTSYRVNIWFGTIKMLKDFWITGIGLGEEAFSAVYSRYAYSAVSAPHSHNLYLQLITENGILGIVVFVSMMVSYYRNVISNVVYKKRSYLKAIILGLSAGMFGYLVQGLFDNVFYNYRVVLLFFLILGLTCASINIYKNTEEFKNE